MTSNASPMCATFAPTFPRKPSLKPLGPFFVCPLNRSWHSLPPPRHRHCTSTSALSPRLLSNPYIPLQTRQKHAFQNYLVFAQNIYEGFYGSNPAGPGAKTSTRSISRTGNRSVWCCYSTRCRGQEGLMGMESFSQTQLEKPLRNRRCSACITDKFELIDGAPPAASWSGDTTKKRPTENT